LAEWVEDFNHLVDAQDPIVRESLQANMEDALKQIQGSLMRSVVEELDISEEQKRYLVIIHEIMSDVSYLLVSANGIIPDRISFFFVFGCVL